MLLINPRESDSIDNALRKYKKKFEKAGILRQLRARKAFIKPSVVQRSKMLKAEYRQKMMSEEQ